MAVRSLEALRALVHGNGVSGLGPGTERLSVPPAVERVGAPP